VFRSRSAGSGSFSDITVTSSVKLTELCEHTGDVMNPNTRALVCGMSTTNLKQNLWLVILVNEGSDNGLYGDEARR